MNATLETFSWYEVPADVKSLLNQAAQHWENTSKSEAYINEALNRAEEFPDVLVAAYRFFYYKNNHPKALEMADRVVTKLQQTEALPDSWDRLKPLLLARKNEPAIRLYLNAYAATGFILAKLGEIDRAKAIAARIKEVDDKNEFGGAIVWDILTQPPEDEEE